MQDLLGVKPTMSDDLAKVGRGIKGFMGVYPSDRVPSIHGDDCLIMNTKKRTERGEHWCALKKLNNKIYFFDSFGRDPIDLSPCWTDKPWIKVVPTPDKKLQSVNASDCGTQCLAFLKTINKYGPFEVI